MPPKFTENDVWDILRRYPGGIPVANLQAALHIADPNREEFRHDVWRLSAILARLVRLKFVSPATINGARAYIPAAH
jgi:hypothetical protein